MRAKGIYGAFLAFFLIGIALFGNILIQQEKREQVRRILDQGNYLVSLVALHPIDDFTGDKGRFILRTLREYVSSDDLVYCFIHDHNGEPLASLGPDELISSIPKSVESQALYALGIKSQSFPVEGWEAAIYEFAKPIFAQGERTGTVRLGFRLHNPSLFAPERIELLALVAFFIISVAVLIYYGIILALRRLNNLSLGMKHEFLDPASAASGVVKGARVEQIIRDLEESLVLLRERMDSIELRKTELETKFGLTAFQKNQLTTILDAMRSGIMITDSQDNIIHINLYMLALLNKMREEMLDRPLWDVLDQDEILSFITQQGIQGRERQVDFVETTFPEVIPGNVFRVSSLNLQDSDGTGTGRMILVEDITNEKLAEKAKKEFVAHVTHELYTPLTTIKSYNEMLVTGEVRDPEMQTEFYNTILEETDRLQRLIENLLNISKIEMGSLTLQRGLVKSDSLVKDCVAAIETQARRKSITIEKLLPDNFPSLFGDKDLLKVAIINILGNAVKYTPENGSITFSLFEKDGAAVFDVADTGYGIAEEDLPHIFDKFYRSKDPNIADKTGSGLGLGITSEIVHLHGGEILVESEPGQGTRFSVRIPREEYHLGKQ